MALDDATENVMLRHVVHVGATPVDNKFVLLDPVFCPIISEKDSVKVSIKKGDEYYYEMITVYKIYGKYYLDDMDVY